MEQVSIAINDQGQIVIVAFKNDNNYQEVKLTSEEQQTLAGYSEDQRQTQAVAIARARLN